jgi:hypothetical protein
MPGVALRAKWVFGVAPPSNGNDRHFDGHGIRPVHDPEAPGADAPAFGKTSGQRLARLSGLSF